ncbi:unnamed protein product [Soboliphyme baturini]|uniref:Uncharacterized protein n=1 Tax=Soboliphyme baturini TaxID=241478 RepID=A0A3P8H1Q4_9BILA|nr:unnamed protein product [Soboliphyme baturini]
MVLDLFLYLDGRNGDSPEDTVVEARREAERSVPNNTNLNEYGQSDTTDVDVSNFVEHLAAWKLNRRGIEGETLVHLLLNSNDPKSRVIAKILIREYRNLALDIYEGEKMFGNSALHLAIVYDDYECVSLLLESGAMPTQRAKGRFFAPLDAKNNQSETYEGLAYYGEYPLAFAASFGNKDIYDLLLQYGADPNAQDSFGNTVLHLCVINNSIVSNLRIIDFNTSNWMKPKTEHKIYNKL